jgi:hypothetical protein
MKSQAPNLTVQFVQKVYAENVLHIRHDVWDVHTDVDRRWVITEPMNLYSQDQFPNMDLALTFHVGLCLRIPRSEWQKLSELPVEPFAECYRCLQEASDALGQASEVADYQSIGVRCREALLAFVGAAQTVIPWTLAQATPKKADLIAWADHICSVALSGASHEHRRHLFQTLLESAWEFTNWLTHTKSSKWHDAEAAVASTENAISLCTSAVVRHIRGAPEQCPACGHSACLLSAAIAKIFQPLSGSGPLATNVAGLVSRFQLPRCLDAMTVPRRRPRLNASFRRHLSGN